LKLKRLAAEQITHDKLEESKILTENLVTADDSKALGLHLKGNDEVTLITRNKGQKPSVLASNEGTQQHETGMNCTNENKDGVFGGVRIVVSSHSILLSVEQLFMLEMFTASFNFILVVLEVSCIVLSLMSFLGSFLL
jgi:hypothetical protein